MSKLYLKYKELKESSNSSENKLLLFKSGIFFIFIDEDAKLASSLLNLKLGKLNEKIVKCGFPISSLEKYNNLLKYSGYTLEIVNVNDNHTCSSTDYLSNASLRKIIDDIINLDIDSLSISQAYDFLYNIQKNLNFIVRSK